jgi:hypothetical protein
MSPHIDIISPLGAMVACMTTDWTEANDIISSASSATANEVLLDRLLAIVEEHTRPGMEEHPVKTHHDILSGLARTSRRRYRFDNPTKALKESDLSVEVGFKSGECQNSDVIIGVDGLHSNIGRPAQWRAARLLTA